MITGNIVKSVINGSDRLHMELVCSGYCYEVTREKRAEDTRSMFTEVPIYEHISDAKHANLWHCQISNKSRNETRIGGVLFHLCHSGEFGRIVIDHLHGIFFFSKIVTSYQ